MIEVNYFGRQLSAEIQAGLPSQSKCKEMTDLFDSYVSQLAEPVAHGTVSDYFTSILDRGLGGYFPDDSCSPGRISVCSLRYPEGLYGPCCFALRWGVFFSSDLCIDARKFGGRDLVQRYLAESGSGRWQGWAEEIKIKLEGTYFGLKTRGRKGWPMLLVYDAKEVKLEQYLGGSGIRRYLTQMPSHFEVGSPLFKETLALMLAPAKRYQEAEQILSEFQITTPILPMEIIELKEILRVSQQRLIST